MNQPSLNPLPAHAKVVQALKTGILDGTFPVDGLLPPEPDLLRHLGVSRVSLREGIKQLEALGWLRIERGNGTRVTRPDFRVMEDTIDFLSRFELIRFRHLHQLRTLIEVENVGHLARAPKKDLIADLRQLNAAIAADPTQPAGYVDADVRFHDRLLTAADNPLFPLLMAGFHKYQQLSRRLSYAGPESVADTVAAHGAIIDRIAARDVEGARAAMRDHLAVTEGQLKVR